VRLLGSRDETVRVWSVTRGRLVTLFDVHAAVCDVMMTSDAARILVRLADSCHVPFLCLHNSPALSPAPVRGQNQPEPPRVDIGQHFTSLQYIICLGYTNTV